MSSERDEETPKFGDKKIPTWIKVMWAGGILWIVLYVIGGLSNSPTTW